MSREPESQAEDHARRLLEGLQILSGSVEHANAYLEMIADSLDKIRDELSWILNNHEHVFREIRVIPADPADLRWSDKLSELNKKVVCMTCQAECTVAEAEGWAKAREWVGEQPFLAVCPNCIVKPAEAPADKPRRTTLFE